MNGERLPLDWAGKLRLSSARQNAYTLLDVAALVSTTPLDLSNHLLAPDFIALSFYKIFGFPDLGALIVRKAASHVFDQRRYFGGGTTEMTTCIGDVWVARKDTSLHARLEDGTVAFRNILALKCAISNHHRLFGGLQEVSKHTSWLALALYERLASSKHSNGVPTYHVYKSAESTYDDPRTQGATIAFNICKSNGSYVGPWHVGVSLRNDTIHVRTGTLCNPAGISCALGLDAEWLRKAFERGYRCNTELDIVEGVPVGVVRVTFGAMNTLGDVEAFAASLSRFSLEQSEGISAMKTGFIGKTDSVMEARQHAVVAGVLHARQEAVHFGNERPASHSITAAWCCRSGFRGLFGLCVGARRLNEK